MNITIENVTKIFGKDTVALQDVSLKIKSGMFGLLGPNGAGKTTLMRMIATLVQPSKGLVKVGAYRTDDNHEKWHIRRSLGYLPQELALYHNLSGRNFLDFIAGIKSIAQDERSRQIETLLELTGLRAAANKQIKTYSGGMKRRLGIAQALIGDPSLLIVDEPTAGLDPEERARFRNLLVDLATERTVILSSHIVEDIAQTCYQIAILRQGSVVFDGNVGELIQRSDGKVWEYVDDAENLLPDSFLVSKTRTGNARTKFRVLADEQPAPQATRIVPSIEDGYLWLMHQMDEDPV
jgi:ABC-type multidrug transport system ATPase subunit